jgi:hypothetical protein
MMGKFRKLTSSLLLLVFLLPLAVKIEHHHKNVVFNFKNEKNYPVLKENCPICDFEYSVFLTSFENIDLPGRNLLDSYCNNYNSSYNYNFAQFSILLRAPPEIQICNAAILH